MEENNQSDLKQIWTPKKQSDGTFSGIWIADEKIDMKKGASYKVEWL